MKKKRRGVSLGTIFMLALTALVVVLCVLFLWMIAGEGLYEKTEEFIRTLAEEGMFTPEATPDPQAAEAGEAWAAAFAFIEEEQTPLPTAPPPTPTPVPQPVTVHLAAAGAVYAPKSVRESAQEGEGFDFTKTFEGLGSVLSEADLAIATLETTTAGRDKGFGNYNTAPEILDGLRSCGIDLLSLGTERALDKGYEGLELTVGELTARGLAYAGVELEGYSGKATMLRVRGVQIAILAYSYGLSGDSEEKTKEDSRGVLAKMTTKRMIDDITRARVEGANLVVVLPHWGTKNKLETADTVRYTAKSLAEAGADVILGAHPNVPQGTEMMEVTRSDGLTYRTAVCYSLGSMLTDARTKENTAGMIAHVTATYDPMTRRTTLDALYCTPVYIARQKEGGETVYRVVDAESRDALSLLTDSEKENAKAAAEMIRSIAGEEGQG